MRGYTDKELNYHTPVPYHKNQKTVVLPEYIDVTPSVIHYSYRKNGEICVNISNVTTQSLMISPRAVLCELQPLTIDESVFEKKNAKNQRLLVKYTLKPN